MTLKELEKEYGKPFEFHSSTWPREYYIAKDNMELPFEAIGSHCRYAGVLVTDWLVKNTEAIIESYGMSENVGVFVHFVEGDFNQEDVLNFEGNEMNLASKGKIMLSLYYVIDPEESFDFDMIKNMVVDVQEYMPSGYGRFYVKLYYGEEEYRKTFLKLLHDGHIFENYIRKRYFGSTWEISDSDAEPFKYRDCFLEREEYMLLTVSKLDRNEETESFIKRMKVKNEYEEWED